MDLEKYKKAIREIDKDDQIPEHLFQYCVELLYIANQRIKTSDGKITHIGIKEDGKIKFLTLEELSKMFHGNDFHIILASTSSYILSRFDISINSFGLIGELSLSYYEGSNPENYTQKNISIKFDQKYFGLNEI